MATGTTDKTAAEKLAKFYRRGAKSIEKKHFSFAPRNRMSAGIELARERTALVDSFIKKAAADSKGKIPEGVSLVALGGYGRREMCPFSDVDILVLHKPGFEDAAAQIGEKVFYPLWDLKLDLGHAVRTLDDCVDLCSRDFVSLTSHLDNRYIAGDREQCENLERILSAEIVSSCSARFIDEKLAEAFERRKKFGSSVWMLEPNVKEAEGALRDLNTILWLGQAKYKIKTFDDLLAEGILSEKEARLTNRCMSFLFLVRSHLHYLTGRRQDKLTFDFQDSVARFFGHADSSSMKAVEKFMRIYYLRAGFVSEQFQRMVDKVAGKPVRCGARIRHLENGFTISDGVLSVKGKNVFRETPVNLIRVFEYVDRHDAEMSPYLRGLIREQSPRIDEKTRKDPEFNRVFIGILKNGKNVYKTLSLMNRLRFLAHYIPEFGRIVCMMQHNAYHLYTVDIHSLFLVKEVEELFKYKREEEFPLLTKAAESVVSRDILYLACLFHDIGKGVSGTRHEIASRDMVRKINRRMGLSGRNAEVLEFLVENHQVMSDFSQKQDTNDIELVSKFARTVGDEERLALLYVLTFADLRSVGDVWNNWKGMLLRRLFFSASRIFESGRVGQLRSFDTRKKMVCSEIARVSEGMISEREAARIIKTMPESYLFSHSPLDMERHFRLMKSGRSGSIATQVIHHEKEGFDEFTFWGKDRKKLFRTLCGAMSANGLDIMSVRAECSSNGNVLDILYVSKLGKSASDDPGLWKKLNDDIKNALSEKLDLEAVLKRREKNSSYRKTVPQQPSRVFFDNISSDRATIVEVVAKDEPGILYKISSVISDMHLSIIYAKVSTRAEQVFDVFYVTRRGGRKVETPDILKKLEKALLKVISSKPQSVVK
ncbi:MAG: [protein-PII] uridylyltransferase [Candidatus Mycalebacterium zealandia]|nr:MAG: [protein-PII] uridylyltransferase [Candidatus Mycalebacterium zealandia]